MYVALLANTAWLDEELTVLRHTVVGLIDEQVRVAQVIPHVVRDDAISAFGERIEWRDTPWSWLRRRRLAALAEPLTELHVDVVHALDGRLWRAAIDLARRMNVALVLAINSEMDLAEVDAAARAASDLNMAFAATTTPLQKAVAERLGPEALVERVPLGVHLADLPEPSDQPRGALCAVVTGSGRFDPEYDALLEAIARLTQAHPDAQFFFDSQGDESALWDAAQRRNLLGHISLIPRKLGHREMLLKADVLIQPQPLGRARSLILHAMANGVPVLAHKDKWVDYLIHEETAWLVDQADAQQWVTLINRWYEQPTFVRDLTQRAHDWVGKHHLASQHVARSVNLYRRLTGEGMKFEPAA